MGDTAKRFSSLLTVICRTAKRSANKVARMRKKRNGGGEEINQLATRSADPVVRSSCKVRSSIKTAMTPDEKGNLKNKLALKISSKI